MARKVFTENLAPHPIEATLAFKTYTARPGLRGVRSLQGSLTRFFREMAPVKLENVTVPEINHAIKRLSQKGYNPSYINKLFRLASAFFSWCRQLGYVDSNPFKATSAPRSEGVFIPTVIPNEDINELHKFIVDRGVIDEIILWGALRMGCRISEPCMARLRDVLPAGKTVDDFLVDPRVIFETKTAARLAKQPRFTLPAYRKLLTARAGDDPEAPLLYLKGVPLRDKGDCLNIEARVLVARTWFSDIQKALWGEYRWTPKTMRSNFISRETMSDPNKLVAIAMQCGNSIGVIQKNYLNYFQMPEFSTGEAATC